MSLPLLTPAFNLNAFAVVPKAELSSVFTDFEILFSPTKVAYVLDERNPGRSTIQNNVFNIVHLQPSFQDGFQHRVCNVIHYVGIDIFKFLSRNGQFEIFLIINRL